MPAVGTAAKQAKKDSEDHRDDPQPLSRRRPRPGDRRARTSAAAIDAAGKILNDVDASDFPSRAKLLAKEIAKAKPDLLGLQEVALWRDQAHVRLRAPPPAERHVRYDFLQLLQDELQGKGAKYTVAVVQDEFDQELPADTDGERRDRNGPLCAEPTRTAG